MVLSTLFLLVYDTVKVIVYKSLPLIWIAMFCKSGILIFIFAENNYLVRQYICPHHVDYNTFAPSELWSPCLLSRSLPLFLSLSFSGEFSGVQRPSGFTFQPRLLRPSQEGALCFHPIKRVTEAFMNRASSVSGT